MNRAPGAGRVRGEPLLLAAVLILAALLRLREAWHTPIHFDEIYIVMIARHRLGEVLSLVRSDIHPPLLFILHWAWRRLGGESDLWLKSLSMLSGLGGIAAAWWLGRRMFGAGAALLAALLLAIGTEHVRFSQEVEVYAPLWLFLTLAIACGWGWVRERRGRDGVGFVLASLAAVYTNYLAGFVLATLALWGATVLRRDRRGLRQWAALVGAVALGFLPQLPIWSEQFAREGSGSFFRFPTPAQLLELWRAVSFRATYLVPVFLLLAALPLVRGPRRADAALLWMLVTLPMLSTRAGAFVVTRDFLYIEPFVLLLVGAAIAGLPGRAWRVSAGVALGALGLRALYFHRGFPETAALARASAQIRAEGASTDLVLNAESHSLLFCRFHLPQHRARILVEPGRRVPFFDGGLVVPDSLYISPAEWEREVRAGAAWWGVALDRALATRGHVYRAGAWAAARFDSAAQEPPARLPPVSLWRGGP